MIKYFKDGPEDGIKDVKNVNIASATTYTISGLIPCAKYSVQVAAMNSNRIGPFSEPVVEILEDSELNLHKLVHTLCYMTVTRLVKNNQKSTSYNKLYFANIFSCDCSIPFL